jgi:hypothetical protein
VRPDSHQRCLRNRRPIQRPAERCGPHGFGRRVAGHADCDVPLRAVRTQSNGKAPIIELSKGVLSDNSEEQDGIATVSTLDDE